MTEHEIHPHVINFLNELIATIRKLDGDVIDRLVHELRYLRDVKSRLFILGLGGGAANASHAVNDFRKLCGIEAYTPMDNIAEFSARVNDEGPDTAFQGWLEGSNIGGADAILIFSVGGGVEGVSWNLVKAIKYAKMKKARVYGVVGPEGGYTKRWGDLVITTPVPGKMYMTPVTETIQLAVLHCLVSHPELQTRSTKW